MNVAISIFAALVIVAVIVQVVRHYLTKPQPKYQKRVCSECALPILRNHKFTGRSTSLVRHRNCADPELKMVG